MDIEKSFSYCGQYVILKTLGSGYHAKVKLAQNPNTKQLYAIKIFKKNHETASNIKALANEIKVLEKLNHPNLVNLIEYNEALPYQKKNGQKETRVCIILELASGGELFEYVAQAGRFLPETARYYFKQCLNALMYLEKQGVCHRDLKLENILLDDKFNLRIADFGFATLLSRGQLQSNLGTQGYMAPEIVAKKGYQGTQVDVFSAGVILFIIYGGSPPFSSASDRDPYFKLLLTNNHEKFWSTHTRFKGGDNAFFPQDFRNLINGMLCPNPAQRFTLEQCLNHPWTNGATATVEQIQQEFNKRRQIVVNEAEKEAAKKKATKARKQQQGQGQGPIGKFRSIFTSEAGQEIDFTDIETLYNITFENRTLKRGAETGMYNELILNQNPQYLFLYLLKEAEKYNAQVKSISPNKYKIDFDIVEDEEKVSEISIELRQIDEERLSVNIQKLQGDYFKFHEINQKIIEIINSA